MSQIQPTGEFLLYETEDGRTRVECRFMDETLWLTQSGMAELYQTTKQNIAKHLKAIFADGELAQDSVVNQWLTTATDGKRYQVGFYNLDAILAVGYRVRSPRGTQFRRWATERLREYLVKGFTMDDERLKNPPVAGSGVPDHFDELLDASATSAPASGGCTCACARSSRWRRITRPRCRRPRGFFELMQNKLHFAVTGKTAAELIADARSRQSARIWA